MSPTENPPRATKATKSPPPPRNFRTAELAAMAVPLVKAGVISEAHLQLVDLVAPRFHEGRPEVLLALALVLEAEERGHTALDFKRLSTLLPPRKEPGTSARKAEVETRSPADEQPKGGDDEQEESADDEAAPSSDEPKDEAETGEGDDAPIDWSAALRGAAMLESSALVGGPDAADRPFAALPPRPGDEATLYLTRRFVDEQRRVAKHLALLAKTRVSGLSPEAIEGLQGKLLASDDLKSQGARGMSLGLDGHRLTVITGGPGTGKTFSVARTLAALFTDTKVAARPRIALAAPTGKAAVRMIEAIAEAVAPQIPDPKYRERLLAPDIDEEIADALRALPAFTLHKLLGIRPGSGVPRHGPTNPLPYEIVVVDEASMMDVVLMRKLLESIGQGARLILLGDRDQLASVDAGSVLADVVAGHFANATDSLSNRVVFYSESRRFTANSAVGQFAKAVQTPIGTESAEGLGVRLSAAAKAIDKAPTWYELKDSPRLEPEVITKLAAPYLTGYVDLLMQSMGQVAPTPQLPAETPVPDSAARTAAAEKARQTTEELAASLLKALDGYRILCTHRRGRRGVAGLNRAVGEQIRKALTDRWLSTHGKGSKYPARSEIFHGMPILVTENAYDVDLRNGDIGLALKSGKEGLVVFFPRAKSNVHPRGVHRLAIGRLPPWMPAFAMTIHKSQGSQYKCVAMVLAGRESPIETRELVYTAVTRAKDEVVGYGSRAGLEQALARPVGRVSALQRYIADALGVPTSGSGPN